MADKIQDALRKIENLKVPTARISRSNGEFLRLLTLAVKARKVLEIGSSVGYSTLWFASALKETKGHIYTTETSEDRKEMAKLNFKEARVSEIVTLIENDALKILSKWKHGELDIIFIDAMKKQYLEYYKLAIPLLKKGGLIIADDVIKLKEKMNDFIDYVKKDKSVDSTTLEIDDGLMLIYKK